MPAPAGQEVGLFVDLDATVEVGEVIETRSGRRYLVAETRVQKKGKHSGRQHLRVIVLDAEAVVSSRVHRIRWYRRRRGSARAGVARFRVSG